jgi:hypothetical protein
MRFRILIAGACAMSLNGCSYVYELVATKIGGQLAFVVAPGSYLKPNCIRSIEVRAEGGVHAVSAPGDDRESVREGAFWQRNFDVTGCENPYPVIYGAHLKGKPFQWHPEGGPISAEERAFVGRMNAGVEAKPLPTGVVYQVSATSRGSGYGSGRFRIKTDGSIENLSADSSPEEAAGSLPR